MREMIIDKFIFCTALGKSGKESMLNLEKNLDKDVYRTKSIRNRISSLKNNFITVTGYNNKKKFILGGIEKNINLRIFIFNLSNLK